MKILFGRDQEIMSKNYQNPTKPLKSTNSQKIYIFAQCTRWKERLKICHLPQRNHKNSNWARSGFHPKSWLSPKKLKRIKSQKKIYDRSVVLQVLKTYRICGNWSP